MAAVEPMGTADPADATTWLIIRGTLRDGDLAPLLDRTSAGPAGDVTLDLLNLDVLTPGGCWAVRSLGEELWRRGCRLTVLFRAGGPVAAVLRSTGTIAHPRTVFQESPGD